MFHVEHLIEQVSNVRIRWISVSIQNQTPPLKWPLKFFVLIAILISGGCSRPNPTPELLDPIYADLNQRSSVAKAAAETVKGELKQLRTDLAALPPRDPTRRKLQQDATKKETQMMVAEQEALYYEIRAGQRKDYARTEYMKAFEKGATWPDPQDFETYKLQRKLRDSPREWSSKIPKTDRYNRKSADDMRKALDEKLKSSEKGAAGGH